MTYQYGAKLFVDWVLHVPGLYCIASTLPNIYLLQIVIVSEHISKLPFPSDSGSLPTEGTVKIRLKKKIIHCNCYMLAFIVFVTEHNFTGKAFV